MPAIPLATLARRQGIRRRDVTLRPIVTTAAQANELASIYAPIVAHWQEALPRILAAYRLPVTDALTLDTADDMRSAIEVAQNEALRLVLAFTPRARNWALRLERWHRDKWTGAVKTATNVDLGMLLTALPVQENVEAFLARNVALAKDVSAQTQSRISDIVFRNYQRRTPIAIVATELSEAVDMSRTRARRIAQDQTVKLAAALDRDRQTEAGVRKFKWRHSGKRHPREIHKARDGNIYSWSDPPSELPGEAPYCGCRAQAYLDLMDEA